MQKVVTAIDGYVVILRGRTLSVGDRITMRGVRGDVIALGFVQTTIMQMGQPPPTKSAEPAMWVRIRVRLTAPPGRAAGEQREPGDYRRGRGLLDAAEFKVDLASPGDAKLANVPENESRTRPR